MNGMYQLKAAKRRRDRWAAAGTSERRRHTRFNFALEMSYSVFEGIDGTPLGETRTSQTIDLSSSGLRFMAARPLPIGLHLQVNINWPVRLDGRIPLQLIANGTVVRSFGRETAIKLQSYEFKTRGAASKLASIPLDLFPHATARRQITA
jgi:hypothetical protein